MIFCDNCGRPLEEKYNKHFKRGEAEGYCNKSCRDKHLRKKRPKNRPKYGATGYVYG